MSDPANESALRRRIRRLRFWLTGYWAVAWITGIVSLAMLATNLGERLHEERLDQDLAYLAMATYGLSWFDEDGGFHDEVFWRESTLADAPVDIWVLEPRADGAALLAPRAARFDVPDLNIVAATVAENGGSVTTRGRDRSGAEYRLHARPTFGDRSDETLGVVLVLGDPTPTRQATAELNRSVWGWSLVLLAAGIGVGLIIAGKSVRPLADHLRHREAFLSAAAHELRTPLASLLAVCESSAAGDEEPGLALERATKLVRRSTQVVDDLLFYAKLEAGGHLLQRSPVRLDLLVEAALPEPANVHTELTECVADVDPALAEVAVRNLVANALRHGAGSGALRVTMENGAVCVQDLGPGFPDAVLQAATTRWSIVPSRGGSGLGLAIVALIARLHGGELRLANPPEGGARATLSLGP